MNTNAFVADAIQIEGTPDIPGLMFRRFRGEADYPELVTLLNACMQADQIDQVMTLEELAHEFINNPNFDVERTGTIVEMDGKIIGYSSLFILEEEAGNLIYHVRGTIHPEWRRKGIGRPLLRYSEALSMELAQDTPADQPHALESWVATTMPGAMQLLVNEGYHEHVYFAEMVRPDLENIPDAPLPEGLEVRPVEENQLRAIWEADKEAFRDHWGYFAPVDPDADFQRWLEDPITHQPHLWKIAWDGDQVAGQVRSFIDFAENEHYDRQRGHAEFISVRRPWRRRGLARALIIQSLRELKAHGMNEATLGVHTDNPNGAYSLYQSVGFEVVRKSIIYQKPMPGFNQQNDTGETIS